MIADILPTGKKNKMSFEELLEVTRCTSARELRRRIAKEREQGCVILSCPEGGYWLPKDKQEVEEYIARTEKEANSLLDSLKSARDYLTEGGN